MRDMTPEAIQMPEPEAPRMGAFSRVAGVFFEPTKTFEDIGRKPSWIVPVVLLIIGAMLMMTVMGQRIGWENIARQQIEASSRSAQMTAEQKDQAIQMQTRMGNLRYVFVLFLPLAYVVMAAVFLAFTAMMSAGLKFKQIFGITCHANLPGLVSIALTVVVMYLKSPNDINIQNPLAFNPAAFLDPGTPTKFLHSVLMSLDLFSFWIIFLLATGFKAAAGRKLSFGGALTAVVVPWALYVLCKSALTGMFS
jgi:hypothetical protein